MRLLPLVAILFAGLAYAEPKPWMKKRNPDELGIYVGVQEDCPISVDEVGSTVRDLLLRARIKARDDWHNDSLYLSLDVICLADPSSGFHVYRVDVDFGRHDETHPVLFDDYGMYSSFGIGDESDILRATNRASQAAVDDYLRANFDL